MIDRLDHLVLTCHSIEKCVDFYTRILGMEVTMFKNNRRALIFGNQKINIHEYGKEFEPKAHLPVPGSLDLCFIVSKSIPEILSHLSEQNVQVLEGPIERTGARGNIISVYIRDPDLNLIELSVHK